MSGLVGTILGLLVVLALTAGTAIAVAAEFSLTALERSTVDRHADEVGDRRALAVQRAHRSLSFQLSGAQLAITITTLITGYIAEPAIAALLRPVLQGIGLPAAVLTPVALTAALVLAAAVSMVFGELVPKNLAIARPLPTARAVAGIHAGFSSPFRRLIDAMNRTANGFVRRLGVEPADDLRSARSVGELSAIVRSSAEQGTLTPAAAALLSRSLRFSDRTAEDLMTPRVRVRALRADATVAQLMAAARESGLSRFPVYESDLDDIVGAVHVKWALDRPARSQVRQITVPMIAVPDSLPGDQLMERLGKSSLQIALVVDEYSGTAGVVTFEDVIEEIVGDVRDEYDTTENADIRRIDRNTWTISGLLRIDEIADRTGLALPAGDYETVAGLVLARLGRLPVPGESVPVGDITISVARLEGRRIAELEVATADE